LVKPELAKLFSLTGLDTIFGFALTDCKWLRTLT
jgi:hypothetical protein